MANELVRSYTTGAALYAQVFNAVGAIWNTSGTPAF